MIDQSLINSLESELAQLGQQIAQVKGWCAVYEALNDLPPEKYRRQLSGLRNKASELTEQLMAVAQAE